MRSYNSHTVTTKRTYTPHSKVEKRNRLAADNQLLAASIVSLAEKTSSTPWIPENKAISGYRYSLSSYLKNLGRW